MAKIKSIIRKRIQNETLMNLAVKDDESFVAEGIVVHNCKSIIVPQFNGTKGNKDISPLGLQPTGTDKQVESILKSKTF